MDTNFVSKDFSSEVDKDLYKDQLSRLLPELGVQVSDSTLDLLIDDLLLMLEKNKVINLTSIRDPHDALVLHTLDSLAFLSPLDEYLGKSQKPIRLLDMGTGGGFPGIPLACSRDYDFVLLDSVGKKISACEEFVHKLGLENRVSCVHSRLEDYARTSYGLFDCVVARALSSLDVLLEYASPFLKQGGYLFCGKGNPCDDELHRSSLVETLCGFTRVSRETFELPENYGHREFLIYKKTDKSQIKLPRKNGDAKSKPLVDSKLVSRETTNP